MTFFCTCLLKLGVEIWLIFSHFQRNFNILNTSVHESPKYICFILELLRHILAESTNRNTVSSFLTA